MSVFLATPAFVRVATSWAIIRSTDCTSWTRLRKSVSIEVCSLEVSGARDPSHGGGSVGSVS